MPRKEESPAFQFYPADLRSDGDWASMTATERGCYWHLVTYCWTDGGVPNDLKSLARMCGMPMSRFAKVWENIKHCFEEAAVENQTCFGKTESVFLLIIRWVQAAR